MDINEWMIANKYAKNVFNAQHIFKGLKLYETNSYPERVRRVMLYRKWRDAGEPSKVAYENTLSGKEPPKELFDDTITNGQA